MKTRHNFGVGTILLVLCLAFMGACSQTFADDHGGTVEDKPRVLLLTGQNNHDWERTHVVFKEVLEETGLFTVDTWLAPGPDTPVDQINAPDFRKYAVVIWDYNPRHRFDVESFEENYQWPAELRQAWEDYIRGGGKAFMIHASNNGFPGWTAYEDMVGLLWRSPACGHALHFDKQGNPVKTPKHEGHGAGHGKKHDYVIRHRMPDHPVLDGLPETWLHAFDELYHWQRGPCPDTMQVLATAWNDKSIGGTDRDEPILWQIPYGEGLVMTWLPGHLWRGQENTDALHCVGFRTILQRSVEWLATGEVTQPVPEDFPGQDKTSLIDAE